MTDDPAQIRTADALVLPGVGSFYDAIAFMHESGQDEAVLDAVRGGVGVPFLGICLGLQLLFERGGEGVPTDGAAVESADPYGAGIAPGTATITATCGAVSASAKVTVVASSSGKPTSQRLTVNPSYIVLKPGTTQTLSVSVTPSSASRNFTYKSSDASVAAVSAKGVVTAVGTGSTSIIVSNGTATASVTVIVNQSTTSSSGSSSDNSATQPEQQVQDPVVQAIQDAEKPELTLPQSEVRTLTTEMLNALHDTGRTLYLDAAGYTLRVRGTQVKNATNALNTSLSFNPVSNGVEFMLNEGQGMPSKVDILLNEDTASYKRLYLYNENTQKWQYLNSYADGVVEVDTSGRYLLTNETLNTIGVNWYFLGAAGLVLLAIIVVYIVVKKRYWFW